MNLNLSKEQARKEVKIHLKKAGYADGIIAKVCLVIDESGSMNGLFNNGTVQALVDRALSVGYIFDDDGAIDVFGFAHDDNIKHHPQAEQDDFGNYVNNNISQMGGGTNYAPVLELVEDFYYAETRLEKAGFLGKMFSKKDKVVSAEGRESDSDNYPVFVIFITDGETWADAQDRAVISRILSDRKDMFIQFIGVGRDNFSLIERIGRENKNAGFASIPEFKNMSEQDLLKAILPEKAKEVLK